MNYKHILEGMTPEQRQSTEAVIEHYRARVAELEKEKADLEDSNAELGCAANDYAERLRHAEAEKAELQQDRERLDWLANNGRDFVPVISRRMNMRMSLRQAIDNARGED